MRRVLPLMALLLAAAVVAAGCGGDGEETGTAATDAPSVPTYPDDPEAGKTLEAFIQAAGRKDTTSMWNLLTVQSQERYGPLASWKTGPGRELQIVLGTFAGAKGSYELVLQQRVSARWSVATVAATVEVGGSTEYGAYSAVVTRERGEPRIDLATTVQFNPLSPEPELETDSTPTIASEITSNEPVLEHVVWVDDRPYPSAIAPDALILAAEVTSPIEGGRHTVTTFGESQYGAGSNAYSFAVG